MSRSRQITGIFASIAWPITAVSAALSLGATTSRSGFWRMKVSTWATCLLLSCCPSEITSLTSGYCANSFSIRAFCAARYGSALFAWLKATTSCFFPPLPHEASKAADRHAAITVLCIIEFLFSGVQYRHGQRDDYVDRHILD